MSDYHEAPSPILTPRPAPPPLRWTCTKYRRLPSRRSPRPSRLGVLWWIVGGGLLGTFLGKLIVALFP